ncbi:hypothetical protein [Desulfoluna spongiiphila]|uniref:hypothetical protein n=1 Tax=Desulfoluna spongiiphila TaxID=419481 RepID=UPI00125FAD1C|nr:hypothetical protein [Desulfoluna spongiiphila]
MSQESPLKLECSECGSKFDFDLSDMDFSEESHERSMGAELIVTGEYVYNCAKCNSQISIEYHRSEYPLGCVNEDELTVDGANEL